MVMEAPPPDVLVWAETALGDRIVGVESMVGGIDAHTVRLTLNDGGDVVLRLTDPDHHEDIDYLAQVLDRLAQTPIPAPRRLAHAMAVGDGDVPLMLQTLLMGDPTIPVEPDDAWLSELVQTIVNMQQIDLEPWMHDRAAVRWKELEQIPADELGAADLELLRRLRDLAASAPLTRVFGHDDFWPGNTLRDGQRVVGVVDWGHAGLVSVARDAVYCAVDMSICYGLDVGDRLLDLFVRRVTVHPEELLAWSARSVLASRYFAEWLPTWNGLGAPVRHGQAARRRADLLDRSLARLG
jgi:aminoglycoside phosphotransferase (APT) family kinase protein